MMFGTSHTGQSFTRRAFLSAGATFAAWTMIGSPAIAQTPGDPFRNVAPAGAPGDKPGIFTLNFRYAPPRILTVDTPRDGKKTVWYMIYQIHNTTPNPQPVTSLQFTLVTKDVYTTHYDEPQPAIFAAIKEREDKLGALNLVSTIKITEKPIPVTKPDSYPRYVSGLAIWTDIPKLAGKTNQFSVYVTGLSDGLIIEPDPSGNSRVLVKTLQLDFFKPTDASSTGIDDVKIEDNNGLGGERWIYRQVDVQKARPAGK